MRKEGRTTSRHDVLHHRKRYETHRGASPAVLVVRAMQASVETTAVETLNLVDELIAVVTDAVKRSGKLRSAEIESLKRSAAAAVRVGVTPTDDAPQRIASPDQVREAIQAVRNVTVAPSFARIQDGKQISALITETILVAIDPKLRATDAAMRQDPRTASSSEDDQ